MATHIPEIRPHRQGSDSKLNKRCGRESLRNPGPGKNIADPKERIEKAVVRTRANRIASEEGAGAIEPEIPRPEKVMPGIVIFVGEIDILPGIIPTIKLGHAIREKRISHPKSAEEKSKPKEIEKAPPIKKPRRFLVKIRGKRSLALFGP